MDLVVKIDEKQPVQLLTETKKVPFPWEQGYNTVGEIYYFSATSAFNGYPVNELEAPATILLRYDPAKLFGISTQALRIGWFDPQRKQWKVLDNNTVIKPEENLIANTSTKFGYYAVVYPRGNSFQQVLGARTTTVSCTSYTVQSGDSLWTIALNHYGSGTKYSTLMGTNELTSTLIRTGQILKVGC